MDLITLAAAKGYVGETADSLGAIKGAPATIKSITEIDGGHRVTFEWTGTSGTKQTSTLDVMNGVNGTDGKDGQNGAKGAKGDPGQNGQDGTNGQDGIGISKIEKTKTEGLIDTYVITFSDDSTFEYTVTNGKDGKDGSGSSTGEENVIESIKVNGVAQTVAEDKSVDITVPTVDVNKNYVDTELAKKANSSDIPSLDGYVTDEELNEKGYLTSHQDISGKVDKVKGKSLIADTEIERLKSVKNYDDTEIKTELAKKANSTDVTKEISDKIAEVISDAPESFDTLKEISDWISGHENDASAMNSAIKDNKSAITTLQNDKANKTEIPTELPANGGNSATVNGHTVKSNVPENAVFTDTVYDDTDIKEDVAEIKNDLSASNAGAHNSVYRGKYLGNALTTEQKAEISAGTFNDLYIGDYWTIDGVNYRIAAFDYWLNCGDTQCTKHHVVIVPDSCLYNEQMNTSNITTGAYVGSAMYTSGLDAAKTTINNAFGSSHILSHRELLANTTSGNRATSSSWYDSTVDLMNESMVYGSPVGGKAVDDSINYNVGIDKSQLPLFALDPSRITNRADWWLRDVVSAAYFATVSRNGNAGNDNASYSDGVRPVFGIKG